MRGASVLKTGLLMGVLSASLVGCGRADGDDPPPAPGGGDTTPTPGTGDGTGIPAVDVPTGGTCHTVDGAGAPTVMDQMASTLPSMSGGALVDGTYVLSRYEWYDPMAKLSQRRIVLQLSNGGRTARYYWQRNQEPEERVLATVFTDGTQISFRGQCPSGHLLEWDRYSVTGAGIVLLSTRDSKSALLSRR